MLAVIAVLSPDSGSYVPRKRLVVAASCILLLPVSQHLRLDLTYSGFARNRITCL